MFRVLVIDDDAPTRALLNRALQNQGYEVATANNGEDGIALAMQSRPALIICDWMMPGLDGLEVCRRIKSHPELSTTFFILLTFRGETEDRIKGLDTGADDFLSKPIQISELRARVRAGLRLHQLTQDLQSQNEALETLTQNLRSKNEVLKDLTKTLQSQKELLEAEFAEATDYVRSLLPGPLKGRVKINARFVPSSELGGDCFDYYWLDPDYLAIYLLDVSGHGLGAALPSVFVLNLLRSQSLPGINFYQPSQVLRALNETFQMTQQNQRYFTIWYGVYNRETHRLVYASAGHPPAILLTDSSELTHQETTDIKRLRTPGMPIGMLPNTKYVDAYCTLPDQSTLYVFSDGIYETLESEAGSWGLEHLIEILKSQHQRNIDLDQLVSTIQSLNVNQSFNDDVSLLQISFDVNATDS
ncbi:MAG: SpoIIE family protein phosphatase [Leptolyngbyaceae cyanobacterium bins.59]|nr:SpoIIE family protein phosphatase [Leptolyngbyaceae cyanobacterium bins.59]